MHPHVTCAYMHTYIHTYSHTWLLTNLLTHSLYLLPSLLTYTHKYIIAYIVTYVFTHLQTLHTACPTYIACMIEHVWHYMTCSARLQHLYAYVRTYKHTNIHTYIDAYVRTHTHIHIHMESCMWAVCVNVHIDVTGHGISTGPCAKVAEWKIPTSSQSNFALLKPRHKEQVQ